MNLCPDAKSVAATLAILFSIALGASTAVAETPRTRDDSDRWVPSLAASFVMTIQDANGSVDSFATPSSGGTVLRPASDNQRILLSPQGGATLEIMTPVVADVRFAPRFFVDGEVFSVSSQKRRVAREGDPSGLREPRSQSTGLVLDNFPVSSILGQGSSTLVDRDNLAFGAGIGIAVPIEIGDYRLLIKPSARYIRQSYTTSGALFAAFRQNPAGPTREVILIGSEDLDVDAIGPGIEFQVEAIKVGSVGLSVFANVAAFRILGDREFDFSVTAPDSLGQLNYVANYDAEIDPWIYRAGVGLRLKWMGLPSGWLFGMTDN